MKKENKLKLNDFNIDNIDTIKNKYKYFLISNLFDLEKSNHNNYKINLNSLAIRHPNRKYLQTYIDSNFINQNFIIDDFIESNPKIKRKKKFDKKSIDLSKNKNNILHFESENLAKIFIEQNKPNKAIKIYKKLILKNSKKKAYFAKKIEELNN
jgi:hypothetical protein